MLVASLVLHANVQLPNARHASLSKYLINTHLDAAGLFMLLSQACTVSNAITQRQTENDKMFYMQSVCIAQSVMHVFMRVRHICSRISAARITSLEIHIIKDAAINQRKRFPNTFVSPHLEGKKIRDTVVVKFLATRIFCHSI